VTFDDGHTSHIERIGIVRIKLFDGMIRELNDVRYVPQLKKNLVSVRVLEAQGQIETLRECVLLISSYHW